MPNYTTNLNLEKPLQSEQYNIDVFNANADKIDQFAGQIPPYALTADSLTSGAKINGVNFKGNADIVTGAGFYYDTVTYGAGDLAFIYNQNDGLELHKSLSAGNIGHNPLTSTGYWEKQDLGGGASRNIGEIVTSIIPLDDAGLHLLDGTRLSGDGIYKSFVDYMAELYDNPSITSNVQIVGSLTDNNGVLSGFSGTSYARYQGEEQSGVHEIVIKFSFTSSLFSKPLFEISNTDRTMFFSLGFNGSTTSDNQNKIVIASPTDTYIGRTTLEAGTYYVKLIGSTTSGITVYLSDTGAFTGEETTEISTFVSSMNFMDFSTIELGHTSTDNYFENGDIDLKGCYIKNGDSVWWNGTTTKGIFIDETSWQTSVAQYGSCGKFVYNPTNNTLRLPRVSDILQGTTDLNALGDLVKAGLPDIQGSFATMTEDTRQTGAFTTGTQLQTQLVDIKESGGWGYPYQVDFAASDSNSIYGNNTTVQPQVIKVLYYIVVATSSKTDIQVDIDEITTDLNNKADRDLSNSTPTISFATLLNNVGIRTIVETYRSGASWYRVYSDGWCEQGGIYDNGTNAREISTSLTFLKPYANTNYIVNILGVRDGTGNYKQSIGSTSKTAQGITIGLYGTGSSDLARYIQWYACGYIS